MIISFSFVTNLFDNLLEQQQIAVYSSAFHFVCFTQMGKKSVCKCLQSLLIHTLCCLCVPLPFVPNCLFLPALKNRPYFYPTCLLKKCLYLNCHNLLHCELSPFDWHMGGAMVLWIWVKCWQGFNVESCIWKGSDPTLYFFPGHTHLLRPVKLYNKQKVYY